jgi:hypothetical protein
LGESDIRMMRVFALAALAANSFVLFQAGAAGAGSLLKVEGHMMRWTPQAERPATVITYSILQGPYTVQSDRSTLSPSNCARMHAFGDIAGTSAGVSEESAKRELQAAFRAWESVAGVEFVEAADPRKANIVIGAAEDPGGRAFANLSYLSEKGVTPVTMALGKPRAASQSGDGEGDGSTVAIDQAYVCLNPKSRWKIGFRRRSQRLRSSAHLHARSWPCHRPRPPGQLRRRDGLPLRRASPRPSALGYRRGAEALRSKEKR